MTTKLQLFHVEFAADGKTVTGNTQLLEVDSPTGLPVTSQPILEASLQRRYAPNNPVSIPDEAIGAAWPGFPPLFYAMARGAAAVPNTIGYRPAPAIAVYREVIAASTAVGTWRVTNAIDIISNPRRSLMVVAGKADPALNAGLQSGVWETRQETAIPSPPESSQFNTMAAFARAAAASIPSVVIASKADVTKSSVSLPPDGMAEFKDDLTAGYVVIVPKALPPGQTMTGWWRVDPKAGETLGMTSDGRGQTMTGYPILITSIACAAYAGFRGWSPGATLGNCGGLVVGYGAAVLGATALQGMIIAAVFVLIADLAQ